MEWFIGGRPTKTPNLKGNFVEAIFLFFIPTRRVFIVGQQSKENEICSFTLFFLICLLTKPSTSSTRAIFLASRPHLVIAGQMCPNRSKIVAKTGLMVPTRAWTCKEANTFSIFQFCLVRNLFMRVRNYDSYFRRHSSLIAHCTLDTCGAKWRSSAGPMQSVQSVTFTWLQHEMGNVKETLV